MSDCNDRGPDISIPSPFRNSQFYTREVKWTFITIHNKVLSFLDEKIKMQNVVKM